MTFDKGDSNFNTMSDEPEESVSDQDIDNANNADEDQESDSNEHEDPNIPVKKVEDFKYLIGTQHEDNEDRLLYQTVRIGVYKEELTQKQFIIGYKKRVLKNGGLDKETDGPIHIREVDSEVLKGCTTRRSCVV